MKKILFGFLATLMLISAAPVNDVFADTTMNTYDISTHTHTFTDGVCTVCDLPGGSCGENETWVYDEMILHFMGVVDWFRLHCQRV